MGISLARAREKRTSSRYVYDNLRRGHDRYVILQYTCSGEGEFVLHDQVHAVPAGHAFIAILPEAGGYRYPKAGRQPWIFSWANFTGELALRLWQGFRDHAGPVIPLAPPAMRILHRISRRVASHRWFEACEMSGLAYCFYLEALRHLPPRPATRRFDDIAQYFRDNYQKSIRIKEVAARLRLSREHFTRAFAQEMKETPAASLRRMRLEAAARLLLTSPLPAGEIAFRTGWSTPSKLDYFFRRHYGQTPSQYRASQSATERVRPLPP